MTAVQPLQSQQSGGVHDGIILFFGIAPCCEGGCTFFAASSGLYGGQDVVQGGECAR